MAGRITRGAAIVVWFAVVGAIAVASAVLNVAVSAGTVLLLLAACLVPPAIMLLVWRGAPPVTIAELLHDVDAPRK